MSCRQLAWILSCLRTACFLLLVLSIICKAKQNTLYIAGFFPTSRSIPQGSIGRGVIPAVELALEHINNSPSVLLGYYLDISWNDTKCDAAVGMRAFFEMLYNPPPKMILFGDACTTVTDQIAKASRFFHLIQLSYADTHPMYTTESYPNFFRIVPSEAAFNPARVALMRHFNWTRVGTIYQNSPRFSLPHSKLLTELDKSGIEIAVSQSIAEELRTELYLQKIKEKDVRIILGNFDEIWARRIFCQAYKNGLIGRRYQWILAGLYEDKWWETSDPLVECTPDQMLEAIDGYIVTDVLPLSSSKMITKSGFTPQEYEAAYNRKRRNEYSIFHGYAYDGIWAIALAIHAVQVKLRALNSKYTLREFENREPKWTQLLSDALNETQFNGVTGYVSFEKNERRGLILLRQFQGEKEEKIAEYHSTSNKLEFIGFPISWRGGISPPVDRTIRVILPSRISITLFVIITIFAVIGIIIACVFLAMNIKYRNQRYIKMSSPYLNNLIIIGCMLTYTSVIILGLDSGLTSESNFPYICAGRAWVLMSGFTLAFGSMFSKTWRVHAIFTNIKLNKKLIKDYKLFMVVAILVFIDVATLTTWQIIDPFYRVTRQGNPEPSPQNEDIWIVPEMEYCQSKKMTIFLGSIYVYKGLLMAFGIFLAWETRHVSIPALNDSKYIGMSVYNVVIMCVIGAGLSFVLRDQQDAAFVIISIFIIFCSTATLCLVFVPKLIELKRNPQAGDRRVRATLKPFNKNNRRESDDTQIHTKIKTASDDNCRLRQRLKEKTYEMEALMFRLRGLEESAIVLKTNEIISKVELEICRDPELKTFEDFPLDLEGKNKSLLKTSISSPLPSSNKLIEESEDDGVGNVYCGPVFTEKMKEMKNEENRMKQKITEEILPLRALSLIDSNNHKTRTLAKISSQTWRKERTSASQSSSSSSTESRVSIGYKKSNFMSPTSGDETIQIASKTIECNILESDDNSYAKAIKSGSTSNIIQTSSCEEEEDTDHDETSKSISHSQGHQTIISYEKRRAKSLGGLDSDANRSKTSGSNTPICSSNEVAQSMESTLTRLFPYFNRSHTSAHHHLRSGSSCPQVRCDIVEYL